MDLRKELFLLADEKYRNFQSALIPSVDSVSMIGVRTPALRGLAKEMSGEDKERFLTSLPHSYFEENQVHAFIISNMKDFDQCICCLEAFLPYVDNWATCDQMSPVSFKKNKNRLLPFVRQWLESGHVYTVRFGVKILMSHFLDSDFDPVYPQMVCSLKSEDYYVKMMVAWYFATALSKRYEEVLPFLEERRLEKWTHNRSIQKAVESYRITDSRKEYLKTLRIQ